MSNLIRDKNAAGKKKVFKYRYVAGQKRGTGEFNSVSNKAALRYCGFNEQGEPMQNGGLLANRLPKGARITGLFPTGTAAKK